MASSWAPDLWPLLYPSRIWSVVVGVHGILEWKRYTTKANWCELAITIEPNDAGGENCREPRTFKDLQSALGFGITKEEGENGMSWLGQKMAGQKTMGTFCFHGRSSEHANFNPLLCYTYKPVSHTFYLQI